MAVAYEMLWQPSTRNLQLWNINNPDARTLMYTMSIARDILRTGQNYSWTLPTSSVDLRRTGNQLHFTITLNGNKYSASYLP